MDNFAPMRAPNPHGEPFVPAGNRTGIKGSTSSPVWVVAVG
jgi:hypothetical protein